MLISILRFTHPGNDRLISPVPINPVSRSMFLPGGRSVREWVFDAQKALKGRDTNPLAISAS